LFKNSEELGTLPIFVEDVINGSVNMDDREEEDTDSDRSECRSEDWGDDYDTEDDNEPEDEDAEGVGVLSDNQSGAAEEEDANACQIAGAQGVVGPRACTSP
jgi:hypothetical protein